MDYKDKSLELSVSSSFALLTCALNLLFGYIFYKLLTGLIGNFKIDELHFILTALIGLIFCGIYFIKYFYYLLSNKILLVVDREGITDHRIIKILTGNGIKSVRWNDVLFIRPWHRSVAIGTLAIARVLYLGMRDGGYKLVPLSDLNMDSNKIIELIDTYYFKPKKHNQSLKHGTAQSTAP